MVGAIRTRDILNHPIVTIRAFGWRVFFRAIFLGVSHTFRSLLHRDVSSADPPASKELVLIERCVWLELQLAVIYPALAERSTKFRPLAKFLNQLAHDEEEHADLLRVCKFFACKGQFVQGRLGMWHDHVSLLTQTMQRTSASLRKIGSVNEITRLILEMEGSEINQVFMGVIEATDSPFVRKLEPFRRAVKQHINYICKTISKLTPSAASACKELRAKFR